MDEMTLQDVVTRIAELDELVKRSTSVEEIDKSAVEKRQLIERKAELEDIEKRQRDAKDLETGNKTGEKKEERKDDTKTPMDREQYLASEEYRSLFFKRLLGRPLSEVEQRDGEINSAGAAGVIPTTTSNMIMNKAKMIAPLMNEITLFNIPGNLTIATEGTNNAAALHTENASVTPAADILSNITLGGYEIVKVLRISATVQNMSIPEFEAWLADYLGEAIAVKIGKYIAHGTGSNQPQGFDYVRTWTDGSTAVAFAAAVPTKEELVELVGYLKGGYLRNAKWFINPQSFWSMVVPTQEDSDYKILSPNYDRLLGFPVVLDDSVNAGDIFFGDAKKIIGNFAQPINVAKSTESGFVYNAIDFRGACLFDSKATFDEIMVKGAATLTAGS